MVEGFTQPKYSLTAHRFSIFASPETNIPTLYMKDIIVLTPKDVPQLQEMMNEEVLQIFGEVDIQQIIYNNYLSLGILGPEGDIVGAVSLMNYPNINAVPSWCWQQWMNNLFGCESVTQRNCLWIHLLLWKTQFATTFLKPILQHFFRKEKNKDYVMIALPPGVKSISCLGENALRVIPKGYINPVTTTTLGMMAKQYYVKNYKIRKAVSEDNDDLVPLITKFSPKLQQLYGDYYIAELLTDFPNSTRQIIVAEYEGYAVAVMILNEIVNYDILNEKFELVCFHGLRKPDLKDSRGYRREDDEIKDPLDEQLPVRLGLVQKQPWKPASVDDSENKISVDDNWKIADSTMDLLGPTNQFDFNGDRSYDKTLLTTTADFDDDNYSQMSILSNFDEYASRLNRVATKSRKDISCGLRISEHNLTANRIKKQLKPKFYGAKNAFVIEVVAAKDGHDEALDLLLEASFESYPTRNYCCICVPTTHPPTSFLDRFVRVPPRLEGNFPHELSILHRNTIQPDLKVRMAIFSDMPYIVDFLDQTQTLKAVLKQVEFAMVEDPNVENSSNFCFLMTAYNQIVGLAILSENVQPDYVMSHYSMYKWVDEKQQGKGSYAVAETILIYPIFHNFATFFLNQLHTQADYSVIFYIITPEDLRRQSDRPICNIIQQFIPIMPRMVQDYSPKYLKGECMPAEHITRLDAPFSLFLSMTRLSSVSRIEINARIVVVGSGATAQAFLETLVCNYSSDLMTTFTSVVVVSPHGLGHQRDPHPARDLFFVRGGHFNHRYMNLTSLRAHLNFTTNILTGINRHEKQIIMDDGTFLPYDILVLLVGEQYQAPTLTSGVYSDIPSNVFIINTETDATYALKHISEIMMKDVHPDGKVIVYGHNLRSHCALAALIEFGIPKDLLVFVNPVSRTFDVANLISYDNLIYDDPDIDIAIVRLLEKEGITLYQGFFNDWELNVQTNLVSKVKFECTHRLLTLDCKCLFIYNPRYISKKTFYAIVNAGLVFDGRLVIDANFRTNDPNIYAAGSVTKYSRKYNADHLSHLYYNAEEVGQKLGLHIRDMLIPDNFKPRRMEKEAPFPIQIETDEDSLPRFTKPIVKMCTVIGKLNYCHITKPGKQIPAELQVTRANFGQLYVTGDLDNLDRQGYFRIHVNEFKAVETITCLTKDEIYVNSLLQIWGKHVKLLNNLQLRFELMMIPDLFDFFKEPWTCAIYYDRFKEIEEKINQIILETQVQDEMSLADKVYQFLVINNWQHLDKVQKVELLKLFDESDLRDKIENQIIEYIEANTIELPMYAHPNLIRNILHDYQKSPMFSD